MNGASQPRFMEEQKAGNKKKKFKKSYNAKTTHRMRA
jgi:hypothetical protein